MQMQAACTWRGELRMHLPVCNSFTKEKETLIHCAAQQVNSSLY